MNIPVVVKIGGSLLASPALDQLLAVAARHGAIVAPGGGPFADAVRRAQAERGFSDSAAHAMAILAMEQTAFLLADRAPNFALCATRDDFALLAGRPAIWRPGALALEAEVARSWDVTSDSLSLWLATELKTPRLVLVKSAPAFGTDPRRWVEDGIVDPAFPALAVRYLGRIVCIQAAELEYVLAMSELAAA